MERVQPDYSSHQYVNTLVHFYRGELGRMMVWRQRFDATTNWAVVATGSLCAFAVGNRDMINEAMLINVFVLSFFAFIEARRYRFYDAYRARVRMLEAHFVAPTLLGNDVRLLQGPWREQLAEDLLAPSFKCSLAYALGRRFRHLYFALHGFVLLCWIGLVLSADGPRAGLGGFEVGTVPGWAVLGAVLLYLLALLVPIARSGSLRSTGSEMENRYAGLRWTYRAEPP